MAAEVVGNAGGSAPADAITAESPAGGSHPREERTPVEAPDPGASPADESPESDDDDLVTEEDNSDLPFHTHPRFKTITKRMSKLQRQVARLKPLAERAKGVDLDALRMRAGVAEQVEAALARRPELRKQMFEALSGDPTPAPRVPEFDPASLPFDVNDDVGKYFVEQHRQNAELKQQVADLVAYIKQSEQRTTTQQQEQQREQYKGHWRQSTEAAAARLRPEVQELFSDMMYGAYNTTLLNGKLLNAQPFVDSYLKKLQAKGLVTASGAQRASDAAKQRIAEGNARLPRQPAGGGTPASTRERKGEFVADTSRRLFGHR